MSPIDQAFAQQKILENRGQTIYNQQMKQSQEATVKGDELTQQANASNQSANAATQKAAAEANLMNTTGSSGNLYQQDLTNQNTIFGFNAATLQQTQQLQNQAQGLEKTTLNQIQQVQGGNRGFSAAGIEAKTRSIMSQSNAYQTKLGNEIQVQEQYATTAETQASKEASAQYKEEALTEQTYADSAAQYTSQANSYAAAAKSEYNASTNYDHEAHLNLLAFSQAALNVVSAGLASQMASLKTAMANLNNSMATSERANAAFTRQEITFNNKEDKLRISAQKQANDNYAMFVKAGVSNKESTYLRQTYISNYGI